MFWSVKAQSTPANSLAGESCRQEAEALYRSGEYHCAEAVVETIRRNFIPEAPTAVVGCVSGFGGGSGAGCICGAVAGGTVAIGLVLQDKKGSAHLTKELHAWFKERYGVTCCKTIRKTHPGACPRLTGEVAGKIAEMLEKRSR